MVKGISLPSLGLEVRGLALGSSRPILGDFLRLTYIENPGMAFGIDIGGKLFFSFFSIVASAGILIYLYRSRHENLVFRVSLAMILGGAVGNLIDRVGAGSVTDFLRVHAADRWEWPSFNVADSAITVGVVLLALDIWKNPDGAETKPES